MLSSQSEERSARLSVPISLRILFAEWAPLIWSRFQQPYLRSFAFSYAFFPTTSPRGTELCPPENKQLVAVPGPVLHISCALRICSAWPPRLCCTPAHRPGLIFSRPLSLAKR